MVTDRQVPLCATSHAHPVVHETTSLDTQMVTDGASDVVTTTAEIQCKLQWALAYLGKGRIPEATSVLEQLQQSLTAASMKTLAASLITKSVERGTIGFTLPLTVIDMDA